jgi:hypothetical protein
MRHRLSLLSWPERPNASRFVGARVTPFIEQALGRFKFGGEPYPMIGNFGEALLEWGMGGLRRYLETALRPLTTFSRVTRHVSLLKVAYPRAGIDSKNTRQFQ